MSRSLCFCCDVFAAPAAAADLKPSLSRALNAILEPVRQHFANNKEAAALLKQVRSYKVTR
jgi:tyrosyl-tRNA synthetase